MARKDEKLAGEIRKNIDAWFSYFSKNIETYNQTTRFVMQSQWTDEEISGLKESFAEPLEFNKLGAIINNILGDQRQHTPNLQVVSVTDEASPEDVTTMQQVVKTIAFNSTSKVAYQTAFQCSLIGGFGAAQVDTEYETEDSFEQCIKIKKIDDPTRCFWDPSATSFSKTDGLFAGRYYSMGREEFKRRYPGVKGPENSQLPNSKYVWADDNSVMLVDYFQKKFNKKLIVQLEDGQSMSKKEYEEKSLLEQMPAITKERETTETTIKRYKVAGDHILEETDWPSKLFGIFFLDQNSTFIDNKQVTRPFVKDAIPAQRVLNHLGTKITYLIKATRYDQWMATATNIKNQEQAWRNPEQHKGVTLYEPDIRQGAVFKPERTPPAELPQTFLQQYQRALSDITTCLGIYETQLGAQGSEISGAAIDARTKRGNTSTFVTYDSLNRVIADIGECIVELVPKIIDTKRSMVVDTEEAGLKSITLNEPIQNGKFQAGIKNDLTKGRYKINLDAGSSFESQKMESLEALQRIIAINPQYFPMIADKYTENLNLPNNREISNRFKTIVPPEIIAAGKGEKPPEKQPQQPNPEMIMQMQQMELQKETLTLKKEEIMNKRLEIGIQKDELAFKRQQLLSQQHIQHEKTIGEISKAQIDGKAKEVNALLGITKNIATHGKTMHDIHKLHQGI